MKIIFLCGCLEPGYDGVGDYTRRLAAELISQGVEVAALALNDHFITEPIHQTQASDHINIDTYRLPSKWNTKLRFKFAKEWIDSINPDWLSLQYVPFSFNTKGLPFNLGKNLSKLCKDNSWHIMFHELWVGMEEKTSKKLLFWGIFQKILIKSLIKKLNPNLITTQTELYRIQLKKLGYDSKLLPLFSNVPLIANLTDHKSNKISFVTFGTIHPGAPFADFAAEIAQYSKDNNIDVELQFVGRCGKEQETWINIWNKYNLHYNVFGEQPINKLSEILVNSTIGLSSTALPLIEKSGSVAAMLEHNLPVICISKPWSPRGIDNLSLVDGVKAYGRGNLISCLNNTVKISSNSAFKTSQRFKKEIERFQPATISN